MLSVLFALFYGLLCSSPSSFCCIFDGFRGGLDFPLDLLRFWNGRQFRFATRKVQDPTHQLNPGTGDKDLPESQQDHSTDDIDIHDPSPFPG